MHDITDKLTSAYFWKNLGWVSVNCTAQFCAICKFVEGVLNCAVYIIDKCSKEHHLQVEPWWLPLIIGLHVDKEPLTRALWLCLSKQFLIHWMGHPSNPCLPNLEVRMSCMSKTLQKSTCITLTDLPSSTIAVTPS